MRRATKPGHSFHVGIGHFYPRSPCGERPVVYGAGFAHGEISIHALLAESDQGLPHLDIRALDFYPRSPCGERRRKQQVHELWLGFLSTLSLRRATICGRSATTCARFLSTLSLRRATGAALWRADRLADFYPRSPCGERPSPQPQLPSCLGFLSTLSLRRATSTNLSLSISNGISIHALLAESDAVACGCMMDAVLFLSTLSLRRATALRLVALLLFSISIHALLAESDLPAPYCGSGHPISIHALLAESDGSLPAVRRRSGHFYPRSPCGERPAVMMCWARGQYFYPRSPCGERRTPGALFHLVLTFLSTLSLRRATQLRKASDGGLIISIHALLAESDGFCHYYTSNS